MGASWRRGINQVRLMSAALPVLPPDAPHDCANASQCLGAWSRKCAAFDAGTPAQRAEWCPGFTPARGDDEERREP